MRTFSGLAWPGLAWPDLSRLVSSYLLSQENAGLNDFSTWILFKDLVQITSRANSWNLSNSHFVCVCVFFK